MLGQLACDESELLACAGGLHNDAPSLPWGIWLMILLLFFVGMQTAKVYLVKQFLFESRRIPPTLTDAYGELLRVL